MSCDIILKANNFSILDCVRSDWMAYLVNVKGTICPRCMLSLLGPLPVYRKKGWPFS